jgi:superfamily I DNA/RNA helicase
MRARFEKREAIFVPSAQQQALFDWIQNGEGNAILLAAAGCGKTTTLIQALRFMEGSIFFGAYNKSAADDILAKAKAAHALQRGLRISTVHAAGYGDFMRAFPRTVVDDRKVSKIIAEFMEIHPQRSQIEMCRTFIARMVSFGKQFLIGCRGKPDANHLPVWLGIADHFSTDQDLTDDISIEQALQWTIEVFEKSRVQCAKGLIDFDDMIYAPIAYGVRLWPNDWVLIDEAQDINPARRELAKRLLKAGGRAIFVGDDRQSVYGFTGAGGDSIERIREEFNCTTLPLSITYRCPKSVVEYVHQYVGPEHIQAHETAPEGVVRPITYKASSKCPACSGTGQREESDGRITTCEECAGNKTIGGEPWFQQDSPEQKDVILCRYTRPLIQTAYALIKDGVACKVEGRDIGLGLISLARMWKITSLTRLAERLDSYLKRELEKAAKSESDRRAQEVTDKVATLRIFIERCQSQGKTTIVELVTEIESMFQDNVADVLTLATGHKAKGREWDRVFWIRTGQRGPSKKPWEDVQEINIQYVIATRAKSELIFVPENLK